MMTQIADRFLQKTYPERYTEAIVKISSVSICFKMLFKFGKM